MATEIERMVDAHIHLWDPGAHGLVPLPHRSARTRTWATSRSWARYFDQKTYFSESAKWNVQKFVHVAAATDFVAETMEKEEEAQRTGHPDAIIGGVDANLPVAEAIDQLDRQMAASRFRGIRPMGSVLEGAVPNADVLRRAPGA